MKGKALVSVDVPGASQEGVELSEGNFFGDLAVGSSQPRLETVTAKGELSLLRLSRDPLLKVLGDYPKIRKHVAKMGAAHRRHHDDDDDRFLAVVRLALSTKLCPLTC